MRDESDRDGMRVVVELRRGANAEVVVNNLYKQTSLQTTFPWNMVALVDKTPQTLNLKQFLEHFLDFRFALQGSFERLAHAGCEGAAMHAASSASLATCNVLWSAQLHIAAGADSSIHTQPSCCLSHRSVSASVHTRCHFVQSCLTSSRAMT